jgi:hypothetical protein
MSRFPHSTHCVSDFPHTAPHRPSPTPTSLIARHSFITQPSLPLPSISSRCPCLLSRPIEFVYICFIPTSCFVEIKPSFGTHDPTCWTTSPDFNLYVPVSPLPLFDARLCLFRSSVLVRRDLNYFHSWTLVSIPSRFSFTVDFRS